MPRKADNELATESRCEQMVPLWIQKMRAVAAKHLSDGLVEEIILNQINAAKRGDKNAIRFVFDQLMGGQALKGATFIQNNYCGESGDLPGKPLPPRGPARIAALRRRVEQHRPLADPGDRDGAEDPD